MSVNKCCVKNNLDKIFQSNVAIKLCLTMRSRNYLEYFSLQILCWLGRQNWGKSHPNWWVEVFFFLLHRVYTWLWPCDCDFYCSTDVFYTLNDCAVFLFLVIILLLIEGPTGKQGCFSNTLIVGYRLKRKLEIKCKRKSSMNVTKEGNRYSKTFGKIIFVFVLFCWFFSFLLLFSNAELIIVGCQDL